LSIDFLYASIKVLWYSFLGSRWYPATAWQVPMTTMNICSKTHTDHTSQPTPYAIPPLGVHYMRCILCLWWHGPGQQDKAAVLV